MRKPGITRNQRDLLERRAAGYTPNQIAADRGISSTAVSCAINRARHQLGARDTVATIAQAIGEGFIDPSRVRQHRAYLDSRTGG